MAGRRYSLTLMFSQALLRTKLTPPGTRPGQIPRPRLAEKFRLAQTVPLTLVSAPAGFGKTTATTAALAAVAAEAPIAWLSLDEQDNDPPRFWRYFFTALETAVPLHPSLAGALATSQPPSIPPLLTHLLNQLDAHPASFFLALDDLHLIDNREIFAGLTFLLENAPPALRLLLVTRADPPLPLHKWRARGQLLEIRAQDLRFDREETAVFLEQRLDLSLGAGEIDLLAQHTEGWAAGLQLAALALQGEPAAAQRDFIHRFTHDNRYILEYLTEEVLARQPDPVRDFLLQTAILDRLCAPLCAAVTQNDDSQEMLHTLARRNLFISPAGSQPVGDGGTAVPLYRYHHLFAALLQGHLRRERAAQLPALHRRAARWFADNGDVETAVAHAFAAADYPLVARLLEKNGNALVMQGRARLLEKWREQLPPAYLEQTPWTNLAFARALLLRGRIPQVAPLLQQAEAAAPASDRALRGEIEAFRAALAGTTGRADAALEHARRALAMLPDDNAAAQALAQFALAGALRESGDAGAAAGAYNQVISLSRAARLPLLEMLARAHLGFLHLLRGRLRQGAEIARPAVAGGALYPAAAPVYAALGEIYLEWNRLDEAEKLVDKALALAKESGHNATTARCHILRCRLLMAREENEGARNALEEAQMHFERGAPAWLWPLLHNQQARYWLAQDDPAMAAHLLTEADEDVPAHVGDILLLAWARLYLHQKQRREAKRLLDEAAKTAVSQNHNGILLEALLLRALLQARSGDPAAAQVDLRRALELAEAGGYVRLFREAGPEAAALLAAASHPYAKELLAAFPEEMRRGGTAVFPLPEPLTERESEVLHRMAAGLTYQQIADDLVVSVNTVRHHVKGLYGKLQVGSRAQAVAQARALGLLTE